MEAQPAREGQTVRAMEILAATQELRVVEVQMNPGQEIPWHRHSIVSSRLVGLEGGVQVETRSPGETLLVRPGSQQVVPAGRAHRIANLGPGGCRFLLIQGVGPYDFVAL